MTSKLRRWACMDYRHYHFLGAMGVKKALTRIICVDVEGQQHPPGPDHNVRSETIRSWHTVCLRLKDGFFGTVWEASGNGTHEFWGAIQHELRHPGCVWVVSWQCGRTWALLDLWQQLEAGRVRVSCGDHRAVKSALVYGPKSWRGLLVAEDPPNLIQFRVESNPGQILWLDCRNWGVEMPAGIERGKAVAERLAALIQRLNGVAEAAAGAALCPTAAGQAWRGWRSSGAADAVHCHAHQSALELERAAHIGGRCECFHIGKLPYKAYHLDFRSHYGAIMAEEQLPVRLRGQYNHQGVTREAPWHDVSNACARVTIVTDEPAYPCVREADIVYPIGKFTTVLCGPELQDAVDFGRVHQWHAVQWYDMDQVTGAFARRMYAARTKADREGDMEISAWAKQVLNSLPGKMGYRHRCWEVVAGALAPEPWGEWHQSDGNGGLVRWRSLAGVCQREIVGGYGPDAVPSMAAWICAHGRYRLLAAIRVAGWENVAYVDTDTLIVNALAVNRLDEAGLTAEGQLGSLETRGDCLDVEIHGIKHYVEDGKIKCSGSPRGVYVESADGAQRWYTPAPSDGARAKQPMGASARRVEFPRAEPYHHGLVQPDGRVRPHVLED